jgi:hypothetical protein
LQGGFDLPVRFFPGQVGKDDAVVVVDRGVPHNPPYYPVVAFLGAVLLDSQGLIHALERVIGV